MSDNEDSKKILNSSLYGSIDASKSSTASASDVWDGVYAYQRTHNPYITQPLVVQKIHPDVVTPRYAKPGDAGFDIAAYLKAGDEIKMANGGRTWKRELVYDGIVLNPFERALIPTGLRFYIQPGYEIQVRLRSSAFKSTVRLCNQVGTIDSGYRGEIFIALENVHPDDAVVIENGTCPAQCVLAPVVTPDFPVLPEGKTLEDYFQTTERGDGAFGSTGK